MQREEEMKRRGVSADMALGGRQGSEQTISIADGAGDSLIPSLLGHMSCAGGGDRGAGNSGPSGAH